jgi:hypothetical protein
MDNRQPPAILSQGNARPFHRGPLGLARRRAALFCYQPVESLRATALSRVEAGG